MTKPQLNLKIISFLSCICYCYGCSDAAPDQPIGVDDFIENISAHYRNEIKIIETELSQMEFAFKKELSIVAYNQELAAKIARQLESRMRSIGNLNIKTKLCTQHFMNNVTMENVNMQTKLRACVETARTSSKSIADSVRNLMINSKSVLFVLNGTDLANCRKNSEKNLHTFTDCARERLKIRETNIQDNIKGAEKEIESCMCKADIIAMTAQECSFMVSLDTYTLLSEIVTNINTCIGERILEIK